MHDRIVSPGETAVFWIEHVLRHKGSKHFRSAAMDLTWYQLYMLDVIGFLIVTFLGIFYVTKKIMKAMCCKQSQSNRKKKSD